MEVFWYVLAAVHWIVGIVVMIEGGDASDTFLRMWIFIAAGTITQEIKKNR